MPCRNRLFVAKLQGPRVQIWTGMEIVMSHVCVWAFSTPYWMHSPSTCRCRAQDVSSTSELIGVCADHADKIMESVNHTVPPNPMPSLGTFSRLPSCRSARIDIIRRVTSSSLVNNQHRTLRSTARSSTGGKWYSVFLLFKRNGL